MQNTKTAVNTIAIDALGAQSLLKEYLALIGVMTRKKDNTQQTAAVGPAPI